MGQLIAEVTEKKDCLVGKKFNNKFWRKILTDVGRQIDSERMGLEVISPFGFELLENKDYLSRNLRRFYAYIGIPKKSIVEKNAIAASFRKALFTQLTQLNTQLLSDFVIVFENDEMCKLRDDEYRCKPTDKLLDIQVRATESDILTDYAHYVMAILDGLYHEKGEGKGFNVCKRHRWRLYQLYIMQETMFGHLLPPMTLNEKIAYDVVATMIRNSVQIFYDQDITESPPNWQEQEIIHYLIKPRIKQMYQAVNGSVHGAQVTISCLGYHFPDQLQLTMNREVYDQTLEKIKRTYLELE